METECFKDLPLSEQILKSIEELGFDNLFPIQAQAITPLLEGKDVIGQAQTGTGKTAAFAVPMIERLRPEISGVQGLVLVPTRELAIQVADHISRLAKYTKLKVLPVYGGEPIERQIHALRSRIHIVVGTPGRLIDLLERRILDLASVRVVVLDEADRMLDMGFIDDIGYILSRVPSNRQTSLFSATIDEQVMRICGRYLKNPEKILVSKDEIALTQMSQYYMLVNPHNKLETLSTILNENHIGRAIIFCRTRIGASALTEKLRNRGYDARALHAGFTQAQRNSVINSFRRGTLKLLVATDVAARGLDIEGITHIINYDVPLEALVYFHRIGRTARMGQDGTAITLVSYAELSDFNNIKALTKTTIEELPDHSSESSDSSPIQEFR
jgi:ATP-dependent RNA helicase DeaD